MNERNVTSRSPTRLPRAQLNVLSVQDPLKTRHKPVMAQGANAAHCLIIVSRAVTNARFARLHGLPVGPVPFTTPPDPPIKSRARHGRH
jgi:hypothetical protein